MVLRQGLSLGAAGSIAGLACAWVAARQLRSMLHGVAPADPVTLAAVATLAMGVTCAACAIPAWRAAKTNPLKGLRD